MLNELMRNLSAAEAKIQHDAQVKKVLSQKEILAWIMRGTLDEFSNMEIKDIIPYIEGSPEIAPVSINPGIGTTERISGMSNEDKVPDEGAIYYDIRFMAYRPGRKEKDRILLNLEAQKDFWPGYRIETRGIFYAARMISAQLGTEFSMPDYDGIKKVVSIWICMNAGRKTGNAISVYSIKKTDLIKGIKDRPDAYDKIRIVLITLEAKIKTEDPLLSMLNTLLSPELTAEKKKEELEIRFGIHMEGKAGKELSLMCNLSDYVEAIGIEKGIKKGIEKGIERTVEKMIKKGELSYGEIAEYSGLPEEKVREIAEKLSVPV